MSIGDLPESLSQAMLVGIMLAGKLGVHVTNFGRGLIGLCAAADAASPHTENPETEKL